MVRGVCEGGEQPELCSLKGLADDDDDHQALDDDGHGLEEEDNHQQCSTDVGWMRRS